MPETTSTTVWMREDGLLPFHVATAPGNLHSVYYGVTGISPPQGMNNGACPSFNHLHVRYGS